MATAERSGLLLEHVRPSAHISPGAARSKQNGDVPPVEARDEAHINLRRSSDQMKMCPVRCPYNVTRHLQACICDIWPYIISLISNTVLMILIRSFSPDKHVVCIYSCTL